MWFKMIGDRNLMSHTYDFSKFEAILLSIQKAYLVVLENLYSQLLDEIMND